MSIKMIEFEYTLHPHTAGWSVYIPTLHLERIVAHRIEAKRAAQRLIGDFLDVDPNDVIVTPI